MNVAEVKNDLIMQILQTNDPLLLEHLAEYFRSLLTHKDWWSELTDTDMERAKRNSCPRDECREQMRPFS